MQKIPVFYCDQLSVESLGYSPSAAKPKKVVEDWLTSRLPIDVRFFEPATVNDLSDVHSREFVNGILQGAIRNGHRNTNRNVARSCLLTVGAFVAAAEDAVSNGKTACAPVSGFHHASYDSCKGFCTFNGLMAAAWKMLARDWLVAIIDCDAHYGDGTQNIINHKKLHDRVYHWTYGRDIPAAFSWDKFQKQIEGFVTRFLEESEPGKRIVLYQAGADVHVDDPLGPGQHGMFDSEMRRRDLLIFETCQQNQLPIAWNLAGGYQRGADGGIPKVVELHHATMEECVRCIVSGE